MSSTQPFVEFDGQFSDPSAEATPWADAEKVLERAELYWITTVRTDGRPHVTPLIGLWFRGAMYFTTGLAEQKARNIEHNQRVAITTGNNTWDRGLDVVVEGTAARVTDGETLQRLADAIEGKYGSVWHFDVHGDMFGEEHKSAVFRVDADKALSFAKHPHAQTRYRFA